MDRRQVIADTAIEMISNEGLRSLTHRGVDAHVGLPTGSTSYYFRTRAELRNAVVERIIEISRRMHLELLDNDPAGSIARYLDDVLTNRRDHVRARYAVALEQGIDDALRTSLARAFVSVDRASTMFENRTDAEGLVSLCEGLLTRRMLEPATAITFDALRSIISTYLSGTQMSPTEEPRFMNGDQ